MKKEGFDRVHTQKMKSKQWIRGEEFVELIKPRAQRLLMLGLGGSVAGDVSADVVIVKNFKELETRNVRGKIVLFNYPFTSYGDAVQYRVYGASRAAERGAVAALVRSITPFSIGTPHTGTLRYSANITQIPSAAITTEDTDMLQRMQDRGEPIQIRLFMSGKLVERDSRNAVGEITGSQFPNEILVVGGHVDSWDVGQGAMDDMAGIFVCFEAIRVYKKLGIRPKRTVRLVFWNDEEFGGTGADQYVIDQESNIKDHVLAFESDAGTFTPTGFGFTGSARAKSILQEIVRSNLASIGVTQITEGGYAADTAPLIRRGVPGMVINNRNERYFWYHHTHADMMNIYTKQELKLCSASIGVMMWNVANINERLPRN